MERGRIVVRNLPIGDLYGAALAVQGAPPSEVFGAMMEIAERYERVGYRDGKRLATGCRSRWNRWLSRIAMI